MDNRWENGELIQNPTTELGDGKFSVIYLFSTVEIRM